MPRAQALLTSLGLAILIVVVTATTTTTPTTAKQPRPHIWLVVVDDVGYADTGIHSKSNIPMPRLNNLAKQGVVFTNYYTQTVCSPSRSALLTGLFPFRFGFQHPTTVLPGMAAAVPPELPMIPELLKAKGYVRHAIGKWHCGYSAWELTPTGRGFQSHTGYLQAQGDYFNHRVNIPELGGIDGLDFWHNHRPLWDAVGNYSLDVYLDAQRRVIRDYVSTYDTPQKKAQHPLFVYLAHQTVHIPLEQRVPGVIESRCSKITHRARRVYCSMLVELDDALGELEDDLKRNALWDDTFIILTTDNSGMTNWAPTKADPQQPTFPASQGSNYPLRGGKTTMHDGGVRSLAFVSGGYVPPPARGTRFGGLMHIVDLNALALRAGGVVPEQGEALRLDGIDMTEAIFGVATGPHRARGDVPINILSCGKRYSAIRFGAWKLVIQPGSSAPNGWFDENGDLATPAPASPPPVTLYNLETDPTERNDVSAANPDLVAYGKRLIEGYVRSGRYMEPQSMRLFFLRTLPPLHGGAWDPFMTLREWKNTYWEPMRMRAALNPCAAHDEEDGAALASSSSSAAGEEHNNGDVVEENMAVYKLLVAEAKRGRGAAVGATGLRGSEEAGVAVA